MNFEEPEKNFREASRRYAELRRWFDAGRVDAEEFDGRRLRLVVRDDERCRWVKGHTAGDRRASVETCWVRRTSQGYRSTLAEDRDEHCSQLDQARSFLLESWVWDERSPFSRPKQNEQVTPQAIMGSWRPAVGAAMAQTLRLRYSKAQCVERSARRKGWENDEQVLC